MSGKNEPAQEIIIVRRRSGGEDEGHHGGVWKIAYADFMTAMMALFLVMWLVNATDKDTKVSIASHFNPIKLTDQVSRSKGVKTIDENASSPASETSDKAAATPAQDSDKSKKSEKDSAKNSSKAKATPAEAKDSKSGPLQGGAIDIKESASKPGEAFRDPFNPLHTALMIAKQQEKSVEPDPAAAASGAAEGAANGAESAVKSGAEAGTKSGPDTGAETATGKPDAGTLKVIAEKILRQAEAAAKQIGIAGGPGIDVTIEVDSVVVSLTDTSTFGMFPVGSAEPNTETQKLVRAITPVVASNGGRIIVRGHTDSRPFRGDKGNNNWRLSMSRAEAVHGMLVRSNIDETRFERIEAYADRKPKIEKEPGAAANRRIDIVLRMSGK